MDSNLGPSDNDGQEASEIVDLEPGDMVVGLEFPSDEVAVASIQSWSAKALCPLSRIRYQKGMEKNGDYVKGRRCYQCPHGVKRTSKATASRPAQRLKFSKCPVKINLNEQDDGSWLVTSCILEHSGHPVTEQNFLSHQQARKLTEEDKKFVKGLVKARTNPRNIADVLSERTGMQLSSQAVRNFMNKMKEDDKNVKTVETVLGELRDEGGDVRYKKEDGGNNVDVLWIHTREMKDMLSRCKPLVFECDTTFGTQSEGYKLFIPLFHSNISSKWEIAGLLFLSTEVKEKVEAGIEFFKSSLPYRIEDGVTRFIFFCDKDFDYISVSTLKIM